jgi:hypothetical protein
MQNQINTSITLCKIYLLSSISLEDISADSWSDFIAGKVILMRMELIEFMEV